MKLAFGYVSTMPAALLGSVSVAVTDQFWNDFAFSTCSPWLPVHGSWLIPSRFGVDCVPAAKPGAWPDDGPASWDPQPDALLDACDAQVAENTTGPSGACEAGGAGTVGSPAEDVGAGMDGGASAELVAVGAAVGEVVVVVLVGAAVGDWCVVPRGLVFDGAGAAEPEAEVAGADAAAVVAPRVGPLAPIDVVLQPATTPMMSAAPMTARLAVRPRHSSLVRMSICQDPSLVPGQRLVKETGDHRRF